MDSPLASEIQDPTITSGDWNAFLNIREKDTLGFMMEEYFSYYEFSMNFLISLIITAFAVIYLALIAWIDSATLWMVLAVVTPGILIFHELAVFWLLATKRFTGKLIWYSLLK